MSVVVLLPNSAALSPLSPHALAAPGAIAAHVNDRRLAHAQVLFATLAAQANTLRPIAATLTVRDTDELKHRETETKIGRHR